MKKLIIGCLALCLLAACAAAPSNQVSKPQNTLNELIIKNGTNSSVFDVTLKNTKTGSTVSCNTILARRDCSLGFQAITLKNHPAVMLWSQNGTQYKQALPHNQKPVENTEKVLKAIVTLLDNGRLKVSLE